jgi:hypothetical protein
MGQQFGNSFQDMNFVLGVRQVLQPCRCLQEYFQSRGDIQLHITVEKTASSVLPNCVFEGAAHFETGLEFSSGVNFRSGFI